MSDPLSIGYSALESLQKAISITGNNIANVNTEGYSRQIASFDEQPGYGVKISGVERNYDFYLSREVQERTAGQFAATTTSDLASRLNTLLTDPATSAAGVLDNFFSAVQDVANNPSTLPERQVLLGEAQTLTDRFQFIDGRIQALSSEINLRMGTVVSEINGLTANIATLNDKIATSLQRTGQAAPDLLDERDRALSGLSKLVGYNIRENEDGSFDVTMGGGQRLVSQFTAQALTTFVSTTNPNAMAVAGKAANSDISSQITGGELGGLIDFRTNSLDPAQAQLGLIATTISASFNAQQALGLDVNGAAGTALFSSTTPAVTAASANTGSAVITATIEDASALTGDRYGLAYDGANWSLQNLTTLASEAVNPPATVHGFKITVASGAAAAGDSYLIDLVGSGASTFSVAMTDPEKIAAALPVRSSESLANRGDGALTGMTVTSTAVAPTLPLANPLTLTFNTAQNRYDVTGGATTNLAYNPSNDAAGVSRTIGGLTFTLSGVPTNGDVITISNNTSASGDNRNMLLMVGLETKNSVEGKRSYSDEYGSLVTNVAVKARKAQSAADAEQVLLQQATTARDNLQGVNLEEEAIQLMRYQQALQAAAQLVSIADTVFQAMLTATQR
jgi:flagellar hook-associated protein 1 FlgK